MSGHGVKFLPLGAIIQEFVVAGRNIVQSFPTQELYQKYNAPYFGETIGRVANRVSGAKINSLNGKSYALSQNNGPNSLHGGPKGFGKQVFEGPTPLNRNGKEAVQFKYVSPDGEEGYPGKVELRVWYTAHEEKEDGVQKLILDIEYEAELVGDDGVQETACAITNHSYFNLSGAPTLTGQVIKLATNQHQEVDSTDIPTGPISVFPGVEAGKEFVLGEKEPHIDHCFIINTDPKSVPLDTRKLPLRLQVAAKESEKGGVHFEVHSTEPAFQFYTGAYIDVPEIPEANVPKRGARSGFCVEPSRYINAVNVDEYKNMVLLKRGDVFGSRIVYKGWKA